MTASVSPELWFALPVFGLLAALATRTVVDLWHGRRTLTRDVPLWWVRAIPAATVAGWTLFVAAILSLIGMQLHGSAANAFAAAILVVAAAFVISVVVSLSVAATGRPRFAMPPHLRPTTNSQGGTH
jgi:TRAP-type C4-dicarboxylate transport system permease large subunit